MKQGKHLLAFVHIGKTGGTSLIHLLRRRLFLRCVDVRPLSSQSNGVFSAGDLKRYLAMNPSLRCVMGHSIRAYSDLDSVGIPIDYVTVLRDPVERCISRYQHRVRKHGPVDFREFMAREWLQNVQTRIIGGSTDVERAKEVLRERFALVGTLEGFDRLLVQVGAQFGWAPESLGYERKRVAGRTGEKRHLRERYGAMVAERQAADVELYRFANEELIPRQEREYGGDLEGDVARLLAADAPAGVSKILGYADFAVRKLYYEPVTSVIRISAGLPAAGMR